MVAPSVAAEIPGSYMLRSTVGQLNKTSAAISKGQLIQFDGTSAFLTSTAAAPAAGYFAVAAKDAAATVDLKVLAVKKGPVCVVAQGAISPHQYVARSATVAGRVAGVAATSAGIVGRYIGKTNNNEHDGGVVTAAADGDPIWIDLNGGVG